jgi:hypothetical protein
MIIILASRIMPRTTLNLDAPILRDLKRIQKEEGRTLGRVVSDLLTEALGRHRRGRRRTEPFRWIARPLHARVDLSDKEAVRAALESDSVREPDLTTKP